MKGSDPKVPTTTLWLGPLIIELVAQLVLFGLGKRPDLHAHDELAAFFGNAKAMKTKLSGNPGWTAEGRILPTYRWRTSPTLP